MMLVHATCETVPSPQPPRRVFRYGTGGRYLVPLERRTCWSGGRGCLLPRGQTQWGEGHPITLPPNRVVAQYRKDPAEGKLAYGR